MILLDHEEQAQSVVRIKVIGVGGAGGNTINSMIAHNEKKPCNDIDFIAINTDCQALAQSKAPTKLQLGLKSTKGLGTGANPELGKRSAEEDIDKIMHLVDEADIVFLTGGMGGGTGSGALPVIARTLRETKKTLCIAVVTTPFFFEGKRRAQVAERALEELKKEVDTLLVIPNQKLLEIVEPHISMIDAFGLINEVLHQSVKGIAEIITKPGHINVDFADVKTIMKDMGLAVMGTGRASGQDRSKIATTEAITSPLLANVTIKGAKGVLLNITGGTNLTLKEISEAASIIYEQADADANIIIGSVIDPELDQEICVTVIATGFSPHHANTRKEQSNQNDFSGKNNPLGSKEQPNQSEAFAYESLTQEISSSQNCHNQSELDIPTFLRKKGGFQKEEF